MIFTEALVRSTRTSATSVLSTLVCAIVSHGALGGDAFDEALGHLGAAVRSKPDYVAWQHYLQSVPERTLEALRQHKNDVAAVGAAWELLVRRRALNRQDTHCRISEVDAARFVAFCEGRLTIRLAGWYEQLLSDGFVRDESGWVGIISHEVATKASQRRPGGFTIQGEEAAATGGEVLLSGESATLTLSVSEIRRNQTAPSSHIAFDSRGEWFWVAFYDDFMDRSRVVCFHSGIPKWDSRLWMDLSDGSEGSPGHFHRCGVATRDDVVYVYGLGYRSVYIEGFDANDGKPAFRFVSTTDPRRTIAR